MDSKTFNNDLLEFLHNSPTPFHAVKTMVESLDSAGYEQLHETEEWQLSPAGKYYVVRNGSSIVAFKGVDRPLIDDGLRMIGAHTDSPCLKVKPNPEIHKKGYFQLGVEVYGGALLGPWFDRDLSLAGRVSFKTKTGALSSELIDFRQAIATIPSLAIHLDRDANNNKTINAQNDIVPILMQPQNNTEDFRQLLSRQLLIEHPECQLAEILDYELSFYDTQAPAITGLQQEFIASARLDNLLSCYMGLRALLAESDHHCLLVCNDHEEVGSQSAEGAQGPMLQSIIQRLVKNEEDFTRLLQKSLMISVDNAHGVHPNFSDKHDGNHGPLLNEGPVIKVNANQRYATNSETSALFRVWCEQAKEPVQSFVVRSDMGCGSTIGPITAGGLGVRTIDIGVPTFAMHSIRELAGSKDSYSLFNILKVFNSAEKIII